MQLETNSIFSKILLDFVALPCYICGELKEEKEMENTNTVEWVKARLAHLDKERNALLSLLEVYGEKGIGVTGITPQTRSFSTGGRVIDAVVELIHKNGKPVKNAEVMEYLKEKDVPLGKSANPDRMLSAILSNECKKKDGRIRQAARGYYDLKQ